MYLMWRGHEFYRINIIMEKQSISKKTGKPKVTIGGARKNAGRPKGSKNTISVASLLEQVQKQSNGEDYEELLIKDFMDARNSHNKDLLLKYHNLILNKVMNTLARVEVNEGVDAVEAKKAAFAEALAKLTGIQAQNESDK
jgi:hypothetical protein